jgi:hypothetical protein
MAAIAGQGSPGRHRNPLLPELAERLHNLSRAGFDATLLPHRYPTTTPRQRSGGESSTNRDTLGVRFAERPGTNPAKRPIREIVGVDPRLNQHWSTRRAAINTRRGELAIQFQDDHGRPPTPV